MSTPLTDAVLAANKGKPITTGYLAMAAHAEKLEAALVDIMKAGAAAAGALNAVAFMLDSEGLPQSATAIRLQETAMMGAVSQARANFPPA